MNSSRIKNLKIAFYTQMVKQGQLGKQDPRTPFWYLNYSNWWLVMLLQSISRGPVCSFTFLGPFCSTARWIFCRLFLFCLDLPWRRWRSACFIRMWNSRHPWSNSNWACLTAPSPYIAIITPATVSNSHIWFEVKLIKTVIFFMVIF